jgi:hypothetical protein
MRREYELVRLRREVSGIPKGTMGTVVMVSAEFPSKSLVDFPDPEGKEIRVVSVEDSDLEEGETTPTAEDLQISASVWDVSKYKE